MNRNAGSKTPFRLVMVALAATLIVASGSTALAADGSVSSSVDLKVWGRSILNVHYDTDDVRGFTDFATYVSGEGDGEINFNPRDTRFGFAASSHEDGRDYRCVFEIDFYGDNAGNNLLPRLRLGYAEMKRGGFSLRAGQDWIPIAQQNPGTVDFGVLSWGGNLWWRIPQITLRNQSGGVEWLAGMMSHRLSTAQEVQEKMPWFYGRLAFNKLAEGKGLLALGLAGRSVELDYQDVNNANAPFSESYTTWLACLEYKLPIGSSMTLHGELWTGKGLGREFVRYNLDYTNAVGTAVDPATNAAVAAKGGFASLALKKSAKTVFNLGLGFDDPDEDDLGGTTAAPYAKNSVLFLNVKHKLSKHYGLGFEVMNFNTEQLGGNDLSGRRFTSSFWFVF